jgi:hypothetical protein
MTAKWGSCAILAVCLALLVGCRTPQPVLKPNKVAEKLVDPPQDRRYDSPGYPKQAYDKLDDPAQRAMDAKNTPGVMPTRGSMTPGGGLPGR